MSAPSHLASESSHCQMKRYPTSGACLLEDLDRQWTFARLEV